jgi:hypothetical protein
MELHDERLTSKPDPRAGSALRMAWTAALLLAALAAGGGLASRAAHAAERMAAPPAPATAPQGALVTIADGPLEVWRAGQRFAAREGVALLPADIVRTTAASRLARIEWADGRSLDLGPATQVLLPSPRFGREPEVADATAFIAQGWVKLSPGAASARLLLPRAVVAVAHGHGALLLHADERGGLWAFAESRGAALQPRDGAAAAAALREGDAWQREPDAPAGQPGARSARLREVPRALIDSLPRRAARFAAGAQELEADDGEPLAATEFEVWRRVDAALPALLQAATPPRTAKARKGSAVATAATPSTAASRKAKLARAAAAKKAAPVVMVAGLPTPAAFGTFAAGAAMVVAPTAAIAPLVGERPLPMAALPALAAVPAAAAPAVTAPSLLPGVIAPPHPTVSLTTPAAATPPVPATAPSHAKRR